MLILLDWDWDWIVMGFSDWVLVLQVEIGFALDSAGGIEHQQITITRSNT